MPKQTKKQKALARQVLEYLRANPDEHDQEHVECPSGGNYDIKDTAGVFDPSRIGRCGSVGCIGGWICYLGLTRKQLDDRKGHNVCHVAANLIGADIGEFADSVFYEWNNKKALANLERWA